MASSHLSHRLSTFIHSNEYQAKASHHKRMILLAEKIFGRRKDLGISQTELAKKADSTQRIISELENAAYAPSHGIGEELYDKLAFGLEIDRDYLFSDKIDRRTFELFAYIGKKLDWKWDIMQFMKLPYFIDLHAANVLGFQISNLSYIRYGYGPFDKKIYSYRALFEEKKYDVEFSYIKDFTTIIDSTLKSLPITDGEKLKKESYKTEPMKRLGATVGGREGWHKQLVLRSK